MRGGLTGTGLISALTAKMARMTAAALAVGFAMFASPQALAETRTLKIYHVHLNERSEITYKRDGKYLKDGLNKLNRALRDWRRNEPTKMDPALFDVIWEVYRKTGARGYINVIGGYRSPATNSMLRKRSNGVAEKSQHIRGKAMDFYIPGVALKTLRNAGLKVQAGGVGYYPSSGSPFVHMDVGNVRHWPRMNRRDLMAVFPDGKTIHVPTDGKPLAGYDVAMASYKTRKSRGGGPVIAGGGETVKRKSLLAALFGGGADEEEDLGGGEEVLVAAVKPKPVKKQAAPLEPDPLPEAPAPVIVATLPRREQADALDAPRPDVDVDKQEALAFAVPVPSKKPRFAAVQRAVVEPDQAVIAAAIANANGELGNGEVVAAAVDPVAEAAAIRAALGQDAPQAEEPFLAGFVPVPARKPKVPEIMLASVAVPEPRPVLESFTTEVALAAPVADDIAALAAVDAQDNFAAAEEDGGEVIVASVPAPMARPPAARPPAARPAFTAASMRAAMIEDGVSQIDPAVKTTSKGAKPKSKDVKPGLKAKATAPTPKVGKFALNTAPVAIENQPIAPEYAQALVRAAPTEVYVAGFSKAGPLEAGKFTGKAVNFLRIAKFETQ